MFVGSGLYWTSAVCGGVDDMVGVLERTGVKGVADGLVLDKRSALHRTAHESIKR